MLPGVLVLLLVAMLTGVLLVVLGLRGRRINDHPACRQCHFDLFGIYPEVVTCPECGAGLKRESAVLPGMRRTMPLLAVAGALLVLTPLVPVGAVAFAALTGNDVNAYKPLALLMWEAKHADVKQSDKLADEVMNRIVSQKLSPSQYDYAINAVLKMQGDTAVPWHESWGAVIERAEMDGVLKPAQEALYRRQAGVFSMSARAAIHAGGTLPVEVKLREARVGAGAAEPATVRLAAARLDGTSLARLPEKQDMGDSLLGSGLGLQQMFVYGGSSPRATDPASMGTIVLQGSRPQGRFPFRVTGQDFDGTLALEVPSELASGTHTLEIELEITPIQAGMGGVVIVNGQVQNVGAPEESTRVTLRAQVEVAPDSVPVVAPKVLTDEQRVTLSQQLRPPCVSVGTTQRYAHTNRGIEGVGGPETRATIQFPIADLPEKFAFDVFLRSGGKDQRLGELTKGTLADQGVETGGTSVAFQSMTIINGVVTTSSGSDSKDQRTVLGIIEPIEGDRVDIVLRPSEKVAASTLDLKEYADSEIVLENVPVRGDAGGNIPAFGTMDPLGDFERLRREQERMMQQLRGRSVPPAPRRPSTKQPRGASPVTDQGKSSGPT